MFEVMDPTPLDEEAACRICDRPLTGDPDDQPDPPVGPMCGDCYRARQPDVNASEMDRTSRG